jgi:RIO-like serine/threonine protein kinase
MQPVTPSDEPAWALVLEHIPGQTVREYSESPNQTIKESCELVSILSSRKAFGNPSMQLKLSIDTLRDFMSDGWCHLDLTPQNIIVTGAPEKQSVVFIDLFSAVRYPSHRRAQGQLRRARWLYVEICRSLEDHRDEIQHWAAENLQPEITNPVPF